MPSARKRGSVYYVKYKDASGRLVRKATPHKQKPAALQYAFELEMLAMRQRDGLEPIVSETEMTLGQLCDWWLECKCSKNSYDREKSRLGAHVNRTALGDLTLKEVTTERLQDFLDRMLRKDEQKPGSINKLRGTLLSVFKKGIKAKLWTGPNPVKEVERAAVIKEDHETLRAAEVPAVLRVVPDDWRDMFAAAIYLALRKGELCGLLKSDVDFEHMTVRIRHSYAYDTTKGGHADTLPIPLPLTPYLKNAIARSSSKWVFPGPDGKMRTEDCDPQKILRTALCQAGLIVGYRHSCRRCQARANKKHKQLHPDCRDRRCHLRGTGHEETHGDHGDRRCPDCSMRLWAQPIPRDMVFHDLRHSTATLLLRAKVPMQHVQKIMRHANIQTTMGTYGHLNVDDIRDAVEHVAPVSAAEMERLVAAQNAGPTGAQGENMTGKESRSGAKSLNNSGYLGEAGKGIRTLDPRLGKAIGGIHQTSTSLPNVGHHSHKSRATPRVHSSSLDNFARTSGPTGAQGGLRVVPDVAPIVLTVKEVAARLQVSAATVYKLVADGALPHSRVMNAVRVSETDLMAFIDRCRVGGQS